MSRKPVVAVDGPAGAGKSSVARAVAEALKVPWLDTGAMYRAVAWHILNSGGSVSDEEALEASARSAVIRVKGASVSVDGRDVSEAIRGVDVTAAVSEVAASAAVRAELLAQQRRWAERRNGCVVEGRDVGTVVLPEADLKVFLTVSEDVRARRRAEESGGDPAAVAAAISLRDSQDSSRVHAPLRCAPDALVLDTESLSVEEVAERILSELASRHLLDSSSGDVQRVSAATAKDRLGNV